MFPRGMSVYALHIWQVHHWRLLFEQFTHKLEDAVSQRALGLQMLRGRYLGAPHWPLSPGQEQELNDNRKQEPDSPSQSLVSFRVSGAQL